MDECNELSINPTKSTKVRMNQILYKATFCNKTNQLFIRIERTTKLPNETEKHNVSHV